MLDKNYSAAKILNNTEKNKITTMIELECVLHILNTVWSIKGYLDDEVNKILVRAARRACYEYLRNTTSYIPRPEFGEEVSGFDFPTRVDSDPQPINS